jgi:hypothetical protein
MAALKRILSKHKQQKRLSLPDINDLDVEKVVGDLSLPKHRPTPLSLSNSIDFQSSPSDSTLLSDTSPSASSLTSSSGAASNSRRSSRRSQRHTRRAHSTDSRVHDHAKTIERLEVRKSIYDHVCSILLIFIPLFANEHWLLGSLEK